jgi:hypothetical protein
MKMGFARCGSRPIQINSGLSQNERKQFKRFAVKKPIPIRTETIELPLGEAPQIHPNLNSNLNSNSQTSGSTQTSGAHFFNFSCLEDLASLIEE